MQISSPSQSASIPYSHLLSTTYPVSLIKRISSRHFAPRREKSDVHPYLDSPSSSRTASYIPPPSFRSPYALLHVFCLSSFFFSTPLSFKIFFHIIFPACSSLPATLSDLSAPAILHAPRFLQASSECRCNFPFSFLLSSRPFKSAFPSLLALVVDISR